MLVALTDPARIAAVPDVVFEGWATGLGTREQWSGRVLHAYRGEDVLGFRPDLVIAQTYQSDSTTRVLRAHGVPVLCLAETRTLSDLTRDIRMIGTALDESVRADAMVADLSRRVRELGTDAALAGLRVLSYSDYGTGAWVAGGSCSADLMIRLAGMINAGAESGRHRHYQINRERLVDLDPDIILVGCDENGRARAEELLRSDDVCNKLRAVRSDRVVAIPAALWNSNSHRIVDAAERLAAEVRRVAL
jgi:iron complex transport system substrate-binding protein